MGEVEVWDYLDGFDFSVDPHDWDKFDTNIEAEPLTRDILDDRARQMGCAPVQTLIKPAPFKAPRRIWSEPQMERLHLGQLPLMTRWPIILMEDDRLLTFSDFGNGQYEAGFVQCDGGWTIARAWTEGDPSIYTRHPDYWESANLERQLVACVLKKIDPDLEARFRRAEARHLRGPSLVVISVDGKDVDLPAMFAQRYCAGFSNIWLEDAYRRSFVTGYTDALAAMARDGRSTNDVGHAAQRERKKSQKSTGFDSAQRAGLADGAVTAAVEFRAGQVGTLTKRCLSE